MTNQSATTARPMAPAPGRNRLSIHGGGLLSPARSAAATHVRGMARALAARGWAVTLHQAEPEDRHPPQIDPPENCRLRPYARSLAALDLSASEAARDDVVILCSGTEYESDRLRAALLRHAPPQALRLFWDLDPATTLPGPTPQAESFDHILLRGSDPAWRKAWLGQGARSVLLLPDAIDPAQHHPVAPRDRFSGDLAFLGNRRKDRDDRVAALFARPAQLLPQQRFLLGGWGWQDRPFPRNVHRLGHVPPSDHNALHSTVRLVLAIARDGTTPCGPSPALRLLEAAAAGACVITDARDRLASLLTPATEMLVARDSADLVELVAEVSRDDARGIGQAALARVLTDHSFTARAKALTALLRRDPALLRAS
jgi:spore maturation protein CgeB